MSRWAMLEVSEGHDAVLIKATDSVDLEWVKQIFPKAHVQANAAFRATGCLSCSMWGGGMNSHEMLWRVHKYLSQAGWEPYAIGSSWYYWRKLMTD